MGQKSSKNEKVENHVAFPTAKTLADLPNITITQPTPIYQPESPNPFTVPPPTPKDTHRFSSVYMLSLDATFSLRSYIEETPILLGSSQGSNSPPRSSPPPPPTVPPPTEPGINSVFHDEVTRVSGISLITGNQFAK